MVLSVPAPAVPNPYPDQTPAKIGERWYATTALQVTKAAGFSGWIDPFFILSNVPAIQGALQTFRYLKWQAIEVKYQQNTMPQVYGYGFISSIPDGAVDVDVTTGRLQIGSFDDAIYFDYSVQNESVLRIPWRWPEQWCDWYDQSQKSSGTSEVYRMCRARHVFNALQVLDTGSNPTITFNPFVRFVGLEAAGHIDGLDDVEGQSGLEKYVSSGIKHIFGKSDTMMSVLGRGTNPNEEFRDQIMSHYHGNETSSSAKKAKSPDTEPDDPDIRQNPFGSVVVSVPRYVAGTGTQLGPARGMSLMDIMRKPTLVVEDSILTTDTLRAIYQAYPNQVWSRVNYLTQMFRMWRGSLDYTFVFFSSPFVSARFNVVVAWGKSAPTGTLGNEIIQDVTIRGTTVVHVTVPYLNGGQWSPVFWQTMSTYDAFVPFPRLYVRVIQPASGPGDVSPPIPFVLFERAGSDFELRSLVSPCPDIVEPEGQMELLSIMAPGEGIGHPTRLPNTSDTEISVEDICRRWGARDHDSAFLTYASPVQFRTALNRNGMDLMASLFMYWSGQVCLKMAQTSDDLTTSRYACWHTRSYLSTSIAGAGLCDKPFDGMHNVNLGFTGVIEVTAPFLATTQFLPIPNEAGTVTYGSYNVATYPRYWWDGTLHDSDNATVFPDMTYMAGGSDFSLYLNIPPPKLTTWPSYGHRAVPPPIQKTLGGVSRRYSTSTPPLSDGSSSCTEHEFLQLKIK